MFCVTKSQSLRRDLRNQRAQSMHRSPKQGPDEGGDFFRVLPPIPQRSTPTRLSHAQAWLGTGLILTKPWDRWGQMLSPFNQWGHSREQLTVAHIVPALGWKTTLASRSMEGTKQPVGSTRRPFPPRGQNVWLLCPNLHVTRRCCSASSQEPLALHPSISAASTC